MHIVFEKECDDAVQTGKMVGIDRGIKKLAVVSDNRLYGGGKIKRLSERYERLRSELQSKRTRSAKRHLAKIKQSERLMRKDINHCITKQIVEGLEEGTTIVLEKLTGIRGGASKFREPQRKSINKWNFFQFEQFLTYKAMAHGCDVVYVDARYTSQRCSKCGHIHKDNRQCQSLFKCRSCGFQLNADLNGARNIVLKYMDASGYPDKATVNLPNSGQ